MNQSPKKPRPKLYIALFGDEDTGDQWALGLTPQDAYNLLDSTWGGAPSEDVSFYEVSKIEVERRITIVEKEK